jgi:hypothetical protein
MQVTLIVSCVVLLGFGCDERQPVAPTPTPPVLTAVFLSFSGGGTNSEGEVPVGRNVQFRAFARFADGSGQTLMSDAPTWQTADANIASVSPTGIVQGISPGITAITATYHDVAGSLNVVVVPHGAHSLISSSSGSLGHRALLSVSVSRRGGHQPVTRPAKLRRRSSYEATRLGQCVGPDPSVITP